MNEIKIRRAIIEDLEVIRKLNNTLFELEKENYDSTLIKDWPLTEDGKEYFTDLINNHYVIIAEVDNEIVGYLAGSINEKGSYEGIQYSEINNMVINSNYRRHGIGKKLINDFKDYCKTKGINNLKVTASYKNRDAIEFYHKNGFEEFDVTLTTEI